MIDKIKYFFVILAAFIGGAVIIAGPSGIRNEIPYHVEIGLGFIAFGCLAIAALMSVRAKGLMITLCTGSIGAGVLYAATVDDVSIWQRIIFGVLGSGTVLFAVFSLIHTVRGEDPSGQDMDSRATDK